MQMTRFNLLLGPFIYRDQASKREPKIMQNDAKMHRKSSQNDHKKYESRSCNGSKCTSSLDVRKCARTRSFMSFSVLLCFLRGHKNRSKSSKIPHKMITKNARPGLAMVKKRKPSSDLQKCIRMRSFFSFPV